MNGWSWNTFHKDQVVTTICWISFTSHWWKRTDRCNRRIFALEKYHCQQSKLSLNKIEFNDLRKWDRYYLTHADSRVYFSRHSPNVTGSLGLRSVKSMKISQKPHPQHQFQPLKARKLPGMPSGLQVQEPGRVFCWYSRYRSERNALVSCTADSPIWGPPHAAIVRQIVGFCAMRLRTPQLVRKPSAPGS